MSHYVECTPGFKDREALIEALVAVGFVMPEGPDFIAITAAGRRLPPRR